jgi:hypothetical protein
MSYSRGNGQNGGHFYSNITQPVKIDCNFVVDSTNGNGLGLRSLKSNGYIRNVFMHTTAAFTGTSHTSTLIDGIASGTGSLAVGMPVQGSGITAGTTIASIVSTGSITLSAATSSSTTGSITYQGVGSPNPAAGYVMVQMKNNFNTYLGGFNGFVSPVSGTPINVTTGTTAGLLYVIVSLGTTSLAQWQKLGVPLGVTPAVGVSFFAPLTTTATGTGAIEVPATAGSGITSMEAFGDPHLSNTSSIAQYDGQYINLSCFANGTLTAPANGSTIGMSFFFDASSVTIDGL